MATTTLTYPDEVRPLIGAAFADAYNYQQSIPDPNNPGQMIPNPESVLAHAERKIVEYVKEVCRAYNARRNHNDAQVLTQEQNATQVDAIDVKVVTQ
jgi:hypothetical protein